MKKFLLLLALIIENANANEELRWPLPDWEIIDNSEKMHTKACVEFKKFSLNSGTFLTDGLIVIKDGAIHYEHYVPPFTFNTPHEMWSVSKTITGALLGIAQRDELLTLSDKLSRYYPKDVFDANYENVTLANLLYMDAGFIWDEDNKKVQHNSVVKMLYGKGHRDMARFAAKGEMIKQGPSYQWNYSSGVPTIIMGVLKEIYGKEDSTMPWRNLFNPLGMNSAVFERDKSGTFIGGISVYITPRDMAKLGYLYLNKGRWNNDIILKEDWIKKMLTPSPGYLSSAIAADYSRGVYGGAMWLNLELKKGMGKPFPNVPEDMYMALGMKGQMLIMIPSLRMIIVRTGHDQEFRSKINEFISRAIQCFHDPHYKIGHSQKVKNPASMGLIRFIKNLNNAIDANTLQASIAKIVCSCHFVSGLEIKTCLDRNNFSLSKFFTKMLIKEYIDYNGEPAIEVRLAKLSRIFKHHLKHPAIAVYNRQRPELGCTLK